MANTQIGAPEVRAFLGGRRPTDRCLYVSTGGFSREARYEADRANIPLHLVDMPELREAAARALRAGRRRDPAPGAVDETVLAGGLGG